jgi:hypothetical protein
MPPEFISSPMKTNSGMAIMGYEFIPAYNLAGRMDSSSGCTTAK